MTEHRKFRKVIWTMPGFRMVRFIRQYQLQLRLYNSAFHAPVTYFRRRYTAVSWVCPNDSLSQSKVTNSFQMPKIDLISEVQATKPLLAVILRNFPIQSCISACVSIGGRSSVSSVGALIWSSRVVSQILFVFGILMLVHSLALLDGRTFAEALWNVMLCSHTWQQVEKEAEDVEGEDQRNDPFEHSCHVVLFCEVRGDKDNCESDFD